MMPNETTNTPILTLDSDAKLETAQSISDLTWHEIQNAYRTRRILTGMLGGIEKTENGSLIAVVYYKDFRTVIPVTEMMIHLIPLSCPSVPSSLSFSPSMRKILWICS